MFPAILVGLAFSSVLSMLSVSNTLTVLAGSGAGPVVFVVSFVLAHRYQPADEEDR